MGKVLADFLDYASKFSHMFSAFFPSYKLCTCSFFTAQA